MTATEKLAFEDARQSSPAETRRLVALTRDESLIGALRDLSLYRLDVVVVDSAEALADELLGDPAAISLLDSGAIEGPIESFVDNVAAQFPDSRILAAGGAAQQNALATRIAERRVLRFVHKPASAQRLKLFVEAALRLSEPQASTTQTLEVLRLQADSAGPSSGGAGYGKWVASVVAAVALAAGASWLLHRPSKPSAPVTAPAQSHSPADALIQRADQAFAQSNFAAGDGTGAAELYQQALSIDPKDARARNGVTRAMDYALQGVETALTAGRLDEADIRISALQRIMARNARLDFLISQLARERDHATSDASRRSATEGRVAQFRQLIQRINSAMRDGALVEPYDDGAVGAFLAAERLSPGDPQLESLRGALQARLLADAETQLSGSHIAAARRALDAAGSLGADPVTLERLRRRADQLNAESSNSGREAPASTAVAAPLPSPAPAAPVVAQAPTPASVGTEAEPGAQSISSTRQDSAPTISPDHAGAIAAAGLRRLRDPIPEFPTRALVQRIHGWVELEFTILRDGTVSDIQVKSASPAGLFDNAAITALKHWRYAPILADGKPVEQRAWLRMRFTPSDN